MKTKLNLLAAGIFLAAVNAGFGQPTITNQPQPQIVAVGSNATFTVGATGTGSLSYQWQKFTDDEWPDLLGRTEANLVLTNVKTSDAGDYRVAVTDDTGTRNSDAARLTVMVPPGITSITNHTGAVVGVGATVKLQVYVTGTTPFIQWCLNDLALSGKTTAILTLANVQLTNTGLYTVVASNYVGSITSSPVSLEVTARPQIQYTWDLAPWAVHVGEDPWFAVTASGTPPLALQWRRDGQVLPGQTNATLPLPAVQPADEGDYTVVVTNEFGVLISEPARLWVVPPASAFIRRDFTNAQGDRLPYYYLMPTNYNPARSYPLVCFFHGFGTDEVSFTNADGTASWPPTKVFASYRQQETDPAIVLWPTARAGEEGWGSYYGLTTNLLSSLIAEFNINTNRVYVGGMSMGGPACLDMLVIHRGFFAGALCLAGTPASTKPSSIKDVPLWAVVAADDFTAANNRTLICALRLAGGNPLYTEYATGGHGGGIYMGMVTPAIVDWLLAQRRGMASTNEPLLAIANPTPQAVWFTGATNLNLAGSAGALGRDVTQVIWTNSASTANGVASGSNDWSVTGIPLQANKTNVVIVTGTTTSWAPALGGNTTFNDTLTVIQSPIQATVAWQGTDLILSWTGGGPPYHVQRATGVTIGDWAGYLSNAIPPVTLPRTNQAGFYRICGH